MTGRQIDVLVTGNTKENTLAFQAATTLARKTLELHYGTRLDNRGVLTVFDTEAESVFDKLDENGLWTETKG